MIRTIITGYQKAVKEMYEPSTFVTVPLETTYPFEQYGNEGLQEVFYQTGIGGIIYSKYFMRVWCRVFLKQTVERQGSSVFCVSKSSAAECERRSPLERTSVFAGNGRHKRSSSWKIRVYAINLQLRDRFRDVVAYCALYDLSPVNFLFRVVL